MICCLNPDCQNPQNPDGKQFCLSCNTPLVSLLRNRFRVIRVLSDEGGFGRTYLSEDTDKLNELCVLKQLAPKFQGTWSQKKAMELFAQEAKRLQQLGEHPQIPTLIAYFEQDDCLYLVQQFINGQNLLEELYIRKTYKDWDIQSLLLDLLPILKFIHDWGVIHRDIKPENIIRRKNDGRLVLIDFGSSKQLTAKVHKKNGTSIGSHGYSSIEQIRDGKAFPSSDLFSLGATCFHLLTGISPFQLWMEHGYAWVNDWQRYLRCPLSTELTQVLDKLLQKDIKNRYQSVDEVIRDLAKKKPLALSTKSNSPIKTKQLDNYPQKYILLRNLVLLIGTVVFLGLGESSYRLFNHLQTDFSSRLNLPQNHNDVLVANSPRQFLGKISLIKTLSAKDDSVSAVAINADTQIIASSGDCVVGSRLKCNDLAGGDAKKKYHRIKLWNFTTGQELAVLQGHSQRVNVVAISPNGKTLVSGSDDKTIKVWNLTTKKLVYTLTGHSDSIHALAFSTDGKTLVSGSDDHNIKVWNLVTGQLLHNLRGHSYWVRSVAISPNGLIVASGSFDKTIKLWNVAQEKSIHTLTPNSQTVTSVAFSPDGQILASSSRDRTIKLWNMGTGAEIRTLPSRDNTVAIAWSKDGKILASGNRDRTIKLWNVATGEELITLTGHTHPVTSLAFSADGKTLISSGEDNTIKIWQISS
ncbi:serine/threonine-protein kinase [Cronbergia sp. UHCC 0137]|uniref:serine/threonine-protein kinase n=1 Tax=Cronbergia sp. UHCC 0137 TaxID=3110239 RepID=UPI002B205486|nr:serine/threonine-protein kinase [Cronbergia sp. UHCC 0137]MEA5619661.1 serine/threonine-protein kinase [Cronbergia sp. UHCC 0137]